MRSMVSAVGQVCRARLARRPVYLPLLAGFLAGAGKIDAARLHMEALLNEDAGLTMAEVRLPLLSDTAASGRLQESLKAAGLPA